MIFSLFFVIFGGVNAFQIVEELCDTTKIGALLSDGNWCSEKIDRCEWQGVRCDRQGRLTHLELSDVPLNTALPKTLDAPGAFVRSLRLDNCGLSGEFPATIASVSNLYDLSLARNRITGNLPWKWVMTKIVNLDVSHNRMGGESAMSPHYGSPGKEYSPLQQLRIAGNEFYENLDRFSAAQTHRVEVFDISDNKFVGRAPGFQYAAVYNISHNHFSEIETPPADASKWAAEHSSGLGSPLSKCDAGGNPFRTEPPEWLEDDYERCKYRYDPSNKLWRLNDVEPSTEEDAVTPESQAETEDEPKN